MRAGPGRRQRGEAGGGGGGGRGGGGGPQGGGGGAAGGGGEGGGGGGGGGGGAGRGAWTARLQRTGLRHGLHERLEALDAVLELEAGEAKAVEPRLVRVRVRSPYTLAQALALTLTWQERRAWLGFGFAHPTP